MIDILAKRLKINYILDKGVSGTVTIYTYGEVKPVDLMPLLETILRINGAAMVKVGDLYRIVPINRISQLPLDPMVNADSKTLPADERMILNLIFLKYTTASEINNLIKPFLGEGAIATTYDAANLLLIEDNARSMKRTMDLIALFDSDTFAGQRVRLFEVENSRPSDLQKELESVFKAYALSEKSAAVKFIPVDRINTIIAVAPNPGIFAQVENWIGKLDIAVKASAGAVNSYVYRLKYSRSETVAMAIMALYSGNPMALMALGQMSMNGGMERRHVRRYGRHVWRRNGRRHVWRHGRPVWAAWAASMAAATAADDGRHGRVPGDGRLMGGEAVMATRAWGQSAPGTRRRWRPAHNSAQGRSVGQTGQYLGAGAVGGQGNERVPHVIPNPFDNTLLIQGTPQEYEQIMGLLRQLDVPPRQVLIDAKIYEVTLNGAFAAGVTAYLEQKRTRAPVRPGAS